MTKKMRQDTKRKRGKEGTEKMDGMKISEIASSTYTRLKCAYTEN